MPHYKLIQSLFIALEIDNNEVSFNFVSKLLAVLCGCNDIFVRWYIPGPHFSKLPITLRTEPENYFMCTIFLFNSCTIFSDSEA